MARLGLFLIRIVVWATEQLSRTRNRPADYLRATAAHGALACVTLIGQLADRMAGTAETRSSSGSRRVRGVSAGTLQRMGGLPVRR
jgi:hypothetical protein